jgi:DNA-binding MarR family transcriptional regulator
MHLSREAEDLGDALLRASRALVSVAAKSLSGVDVTLPQWRALVVISSRERTTVSTLAQALDVHTTTVTRLCDRLVEKDLVLRVANVADRRMTELHLTAAGERLVHHVTNRRRRELRQIANRMTPTAARAAVNALAAFADAAGEPTATVDLFGWDESAPAS